MLLQWGRSFSERRTGGGGGGSGGGATSFNGAALFQSGEHDDGSNAIAVITRFNGAALFQSGEHGIALMQGLADIASMGPLFFRAENGRLGS